MTTVNVTFDASNQSFSFSQQIVTVAANTEETINFTLATINSRTSQVASFDSFGGLPDPPFTTTINPQTATVVDDNIPAPEKPVTFDYTVTVTYDGQQYTSPDPAIVNSGTG